jgi:hypothetical protein
MWTGYHSKLHCLSWVARDRTLLAPPDFPIVHNPPATLVSFSAFSAVICVSEAPRRIPVTGLSPQKRHSVRATKHDRWHANFLWERAFTGVRGERLELT